MLLSGHMFALVLIGTRALSAATFMTDTPSTLAALSASGIDQLPASGSQAVSRTVLQSALDDNELLRQQACINDQRTKAIAAFGPGRARREELRRIDDFQVAFDASWESEAAPMLPCSILAPSGADRLTQSTLPISSTADLSAMATSPTSDGLSTRLLDVVDDRELQRKVKDEVGRELRDQAVRQDQFARQEPQQRQQAIGNSTANSITKEREIKQQQQRPQQPGNNTAAYSTKDREIKPPQQQQQQQRQQQVSDDSTAKDREAQQQQQQQRQQQLAKDKEAKDREAKDKQQQQAARDKEARERQQAVAATTATATTTSQAKTTTPPTNKGGGGGGTAGASRPAGDVKLATQTVPQPGSNVHAATVSSASSSAPPQPSSSGTIAGAARPKRKRRLGFSRQNGGEVAGR